MSKSTELDLLREITCGMGTGLELQRYLDIPARTRATHIMQPDARVELTFYPTTRASHSQNLSASWRASIGLACPSLKRSLVLPTFCPVARLFCPDASRQLPLAQVFCGELRTSSACLNRAPPLHARLRSSLLGGVVQNLDAEAYTTQWTGCAARVAGRSLCESGTPTVAPDIRILFGTRQFSRDW